MLNYSKIVWIVFICWTLSNALLVSGLLGGLLDPVDDVLVPGGSENVDENLILCGLQTVNATNSQSKCPRC